jgi:hypothetical protein
MYDEQHSGFEIIRFDRDLYHYLIYKEPDSVLEKHKEILNLLGENIFGIGNSDSIGFYSRLKTYFSEPNLLNLYKDEQNSFNDISAVDKELSQAFGIFFEHFPQIQQPKIYLHVSGLYQNIILTDSILSLSADKYLGADYPLYENFFYDYQRQQMTADRIAPDYLIGFMMANFPFKGNEDILLDRILYEGKLRYILAKLLPNRQACEYVAYTEEQYTWCNNNAAQIWKTILGNQHLFSANYLTTIQYLSESQHTTFLAAESPGRVGIWLGYRIISAFMERNPHTSLQELIDRIDYNEMLKQSKYKP